MRDARGRDVPNDALRVCSCMSTAGSTKAAAFLAAMTTGCVSMPTVLAHVIGSSDRDRAFHRLTTIPASRRANAE